MICKNFLKAIFASPGGKYSFRVSVSDALETLFHLILIIHLKDVSSFYKVCQFLIRWDLSQAPVTMLKPVGG